MDFEASENLKNKGYDMNIEDLLKKRGMDIDRKEIDDALATYSDAIPEEIKEEEIATIISILTQNSCNEMGTIVQFSSSKVEDENYVTVGILTGDWPGLVDSTTGLFHHLGFNIFYCKGMMIKHDSEQLGFVLIVLRFHTNEEYNHFHEIQPRIEEMLKYISIGMKSKEKILASGNFKLFLLNDLLTKLDENMKDMSDDEKRRFQREIELFIVSRSTSYLSERSTSTIAEQILTNFKLQIKVRSSRGSVQLRILNIESTQQPLTNVTIVGYADQVSLDNCLEAIRRVVPGMIIRYNKDFTTSDGIIIMQIEMVHLDDSLLTESEIEKLEQVLSNLPKRKRLKEVYTADGKGGIENELRIIIPALIKEYQRSSIPQVLIDLKRETDLALEFRLMIVTETGLEKPSSTAGFISTIQDTKGIQIKTIVPPRIMGNVEVSIFDLEVERVQFMSNEEIYEHLRQKITNLIGKYRDFDEGMRRRDITNIKILIKAPEFSRYNEDLIKQVYFNLDDFYRAGAFIEEIAAHIRLCLDVLNEARHLSKRVDIKGICSYRVLANDTRVPLSSIFAVYLSQDKPDLLPKWISSFPSLEVTMSKIPIGSEVIYLFRITKEKKPLDDAVFNQLMEDMLKIGVEG